MPDKRLYFIALIPPEPFRSEAWELKEYFRDQYNSKASLNSPPHITLHAPFRLSGPEEELIQALQQTAEISTTFEVGLENFGAFPPRVIYIDVRENKTMERLQAQIKEAVGSYAEDNRQQGERGFHPHMTLGFRDLSKENFKIAWQEFKERELSYAWEAREFTLLRHNGHRWEEHRHFGLPE